jgi:DUF971 family protein
VTSASGGAGQAGGPRVARIAQQDDRTLRITWTTGQTRLYDVVDLRRRCPCAHCRDEWTGAARLGPDDIPDTVRPVEIRAVGRYALRIAFTDGHDTGIYPFVALAEAGTVA